MLFQGFRVINSVGVVIVVEIDIDGADVAAIILNPIGPVLQCSRGVIAGVSAGCAVETDVDNIACNYARSFEAAEVVNAKAGAEFIQ